MATLCKTCGKYQKFLYCNECTKKNDYSDIYLKKSLCEYVLELKKKDKLSLKERNDIKFITERQEAIQDRCENMETLADLKRALNKGVRLKLINSKWSKANIDKVRYVTQTQTNGIYLSGDIEKRGSFLEYPKASLLEITEKGFKIFCSGDRDLTKEEQEILNKKITDDTIKGELSLEYEFIEE